MENLHYKEKISKNILDNIINKGEVSEAFIQNPGNDLKFPKLGSEIKDKLQNLIIDKKIKINAVYSGIVELSSALPEPLDENRGWYFTDNKEKLLAMCPMLSKVFSFEQCYPSNMKAQSECLDYSSGRVERSVDSDESCALYRKYNEMVESCASACIDLLTAEAMERNIKTEDTYFLDVKQLKTLGL